MKIAAWTCPVCQTTTTYKSRHQHWAMQHLAQLGAWQNQPWHATVAPIWIERLPVPPPPVLPDRIGPLANAHRCPYCGKSVLWSSVPAHYRRKHPDAAVPVEPPRPPRTDERRKVANVPLQPPPHDD